MVSVTHQWSRQRHRPPRPPSGLPWRQSPIATTL